MSNVRHSYRLAYSRFRLMRNDGIKGVVVSFVADGLGFFQTAGSKGTPLISVIRAPRSPGRYLPACCPHMTVSYRRLMAEHSREVGPVPLPR